MTDPVEARARENLGDLRYEAERIAGAGLTPTQVIEALEAATRSGG
ncbi:hypothetical protein [Streptomyces sp. NPDC001970]